MIAGNRSRLLGLLVLAALTAVPVAAQDEPEEQWFALFLAGKKSGHVHSTRAVEEGVVTNTETMAIGIERFGTKIEITATVATRETEDGKPLGFTYEQKLSGVLNRKVGRIGDDGRLHLEVESMGRKTSTVMDWPEGAVLTEGGALVVQEMKMEKGETAKFMQFDPETLTALEATLTVGRLEAVDLLGRVVELRRMEVALNYSGFAVRTVSWLDEDREALLTELSMLGMALRLVACPREVALSPNEPSDFFDNTVVVIDPALTDEQKAGPLTWQLAPGAGADALDLPVTDEQSVAPREGGGADVTVRTPAMPEGVAMPYEGDDEAALEALKSSQWIQSDAEAVKELAERAVGEATDAADAARRIEAFVRDYIRKKDLSVGYASALEVVKTRQGDCTEHALLCAALGRAAGIPARIATGMGYVEGRNGKGLMVGHAWTQVYLDGKWYSIDAALDGFDAAHITQGVGQGAPSDFLGAFQDPVFRVEGVRKPE